MKYFFYASLVAILLGNGFLFACRNQLKDKIAQKTKAIDSLKIKLEVIKQKKIQLIWEYAKANYQFQGNILVASKGKIVFKASHGIANFQTNTPLTLETVFPIASITQGFTAIAILQLAERSKLNVHDKLTKYYPNFPYPTITIADLLRQVSGIPDYLTSFYTPQNQPLTHAYKQNVIDWLMQTSPKVRFPPKEAQAISSTNYVLLADIVEKVAGISFTQYLEENIWKPLDMKNTYLKEPKKKYNFARATGYAADLKLLADESYVDFVYGDCGIHSTVEDLYKWEQALHSELILSKVAIEQFGLKVVLPNKRPTKYSMGWYIEKNTQVQKGNWLGFKTYLVRNIEDDYTIIILNNTQNLRTYTLGEAIQAELKGEKYKLP